MHTYPADFDRREIYRPFLKRLNPASGTAELQYLVTPQHDPRDPDQPPIHEAFANTAELSPGTQMALVGGIGSGKTTELRLTHNRLARHSDAFNIFLDLAELTDIDKLNPGAVLIAIGLRIFEQLKGADREALVEAHQKLKVLAKGQTKWVDQGEFDERGYDDGHDLVAVKIPGLLTARFPAVERNVQDVFNLLVRIAEPLMNSEAQITVLIDGLDRLITPEAFRRFAEQDLRALRGSKISAIVAAPILMWFDGSRFLHDYFDDVKHIPAAITDPAKSDFLKQILIRRKASEVMDESEVVEIARFSGGVLRDLITLARTFGGSSLSGRQRSRECIACPFGNSATWTKVSHRTG